jgi:c(7)-type cytochrome triheme protein
MPAVSFSHSSHASWLSCGNCHPAPFEMSKRGPTISMARIWAGEFCGKCHGSVAFPVTQCDRCHRGDAVPGNLAERLTTEIKNALTGRPQGICTVSDREGRPIVTIDSTTGQRTKPAAGSAGGGRPGKERSQTSLISLSLSCP